MNMNDASETLVDICFEGHNLPRLFDAFRSCKNSGTITFSPHEITVVAHDFSNALDGSKEYISFMEFALSKHSAIKYNVKEQIKRSIDIGGMIKILNAKAFKSKAKDPIALTLQIFVSNPHKLIIKLRKTHSIGSGEAIHSIPAGKVGDDDIEYSHDYSRYCARVLDSTDLRDKINSLFSNNHKIGGIRLNSKEVVITGEGDGPEYAKSNYSQFSIPAPCPIEDEAALDFNAEGIFELARLKAFVRLPSLAKSVVIYLEDQKPLLLEYIIEHPKLQVSEVCSRCGTCRIPDKAQGYVRFVLVPQ